MAGGPLPGRACKLYFNAGSFATPSWTLVPQVIDLSYTMPTEWAGVPSRDSIWNFEVKALIGLILTFGYRYRQGVTDAVFDALRPMALAETKTEFAICDGLIATSGNEYLRATYQMQMDGDQGLTAGVQQNFELHLTSEEDSGVKREPSWVTV